MKTLKSMFEKVMEAARQDKQRTKLVVAGAVVVLVVLFGVTQAMTSDGGRQRTLNRAMLKLLNAESFHTVVDFDLDLPTPRSGRERRLVDVAVDIEGDVQWVDGQPQLAGDLRLETTGRGIILFADGALRLLPQAVAFRLDNLPTILNPNGNLVEKWTYVETPVLETRNQEQVREALIGVVSDMEFVGKVTEGEQDQLHFRRSFSEEQEQVLVEVFRHGKSGNRALHVLARLLRAYNVGSFEVWLDEEDKMVRKVLLIFVDSEDENQEQAATLALTIDDYGKAVILEEPPKELTVNPEVFGRIFGRGEVPDLGQ